jgi:4a-hydroxytetrahydrobiopterin dehydratase
MSDAPLSEQRCQPCDGGVAPFTLDQAQSLMKQLSTAWKLAQDGRSIRGEWKFRNFYHAMSFTNAVAHIANTEDHHPDLEVGYGYCRMTFNTHAIGGLSQNDFICAAKVDSLPRT